MPLCPRYRGKHPITPTKKRGQPRHFPQIYFENHERGKLNSVTALAIIEWRTILDVTKNKIKKNEQLGYYEQLSFTLVDTKIKIKKNEQPRYYEQLNLTLIDVYPKITNIDPKRRVNKNAWNNRQPDNNTCHYRMKNYPWHYEKHTCIPITSYPRCYEK